MDNKVDGNKNIIIRYFNGLINQNSDKENIKYFLHIYNYNQEKYFFLNS